MDYTYDQLRRVLKDRFDPEAEYVLETHGGAIVKQGQGWEAVGEVQDSTDNPKGTMVIMQKPQPKEPETIHPEPHEPVAEPASPQGSLAVKVNTHVN